MFVLFCSLQIEFACAWCPTSGRCSSGIDRLKENWEKEECHLVNVTRADFCFEPASSQQQQQVETQHQFYNSSLILVNIFEIQCYKLSRLLKYCKIPRMERFLVVYMCIKIYSMHSFFALPG